MPGLKDKIIPADRAIIEQIEKQTDIKLKPLPLNEIKYYGNNGYTLDKKGQVQGLNLDHRKIKDISFLSGLGRLTHLSLKENQITDLTPLTALINLSRLWLIRNKITDLTPLRALTNLIELYLWMSQITDLTPLRELTNLIALDLYRNKITDLTPLSELTNLKKLNLSENQITDLKPLRELYNLKMLYLYNNQITDLMPLLELMNLTELDLRHNHIKDLSSLNSLINLTYLYLAHNQITDITPLRKLKRLEKLDLLENHIKKLSPDITVWWPGMEMNWNRTSPSKGLNLYGNPLTDPPVEIVKQGKAAIKNYFAEMAEASVLFLECKLLLVGSGDVGKTTLMKKLKDNTFQVVPGKEDTTRRVDIQPWQLSCPFPDGLSREVKVHFWDFGGQDILHATHQFFLTKRSLYLFVWDPRKEEETRGFDYWLNAVKLFGAGSPLIMVMNKADLRLKHIDEASFQDKYPKIARFLQVSCLTGQHIPELTETIRMAFSRMPHLLDKLPKRWMDIRDELKARPENYLSQDDYFDVCAGHRMEQDKALFLSDYLHDLGIILHFRHDPVLAGTVILKPEWATGAVYALIDSLEIQRNKGRFTRTALSKYWNAKLYPQDKYEQLLRLMEKFELCFKIAETDDYIIPELLATQRPAGVNTETYRSVENLQLQYSYDFMPAGILTRFICRLHYLIRDDHYWNNGVELWFSGSGALAVSDAAEKRIRVSVTGSEKSQLMGVIRSHFDHIHETMNMKKQEHVFEQVPCTCTQCRNTGKPHFFDYDMLRRLEEKGKETHCNKSLEDISPGTLLNGFLPAGETGNFFDTLVTTLSQLQGLKRTLLPQENNRNTVLANLLRARGHRALDQTLADSSETGDSLGELDIKIEDDTGRAVSIIEALNLDSLNTASINRHIRKLFHNYDCSGLKENYIIVYAAGKDFAGLCEKYREHLEQIDYETYPLKGKITAKETGLNKIAAFQARHRCHKSETVLIHLLVEM